MKLMALLKLMDVAFVFTNDSKCGVLRLSSFADSSSQLYFSFYTGRQTNKMCVARSVWRWDTGPMNARGSVNTCTDQPGLLR